MIDVNELKFDEKGLIPAVVQDYRSKKVLTVAYMNKESLEITMREKKTCFYSRSRQELWRKGETSGNYQNVVNITADCDKDALVVEVDKVGPCLRILIFPRWPSRLFVPTMKSCMTIRTCPASW